MTEPVLRARLSQTLVTGEIVLLEEDDPPVRSRNGERRDEPGNSALQGLLQL
jgi:hypothetical protein